MNVFGKISQKTKITNETKIIIEIWFQSTIKKFKVAAHPALSKGEKYYEFPDEFDIKYHFKSGENLLAELQYLIDNDIKDKGE